MLRYPALRSEPVRRKPQSSPRRLPRGTAMRNISPSGSPAGEDAVLGCDPSHVRALAHSAVRESSADRPRSPP